MNLSERDKVIREIIEKIIGGVHYYTVNHAMEELSVCEENYEYLKELFNDERHKITVAHVLRDKYLPEKAQELFELFSVSDDAYVRCIAANIGKDYCIDLTRFFAEIECKSKAILENTEGKLAFLAKYAEEYRVDVSDDGESAVMYNPVGGEAIFVDYGEGYAGGEYTISFPQK